MSDNLCCGFCLWNSLHDSTATETFKCFDQIPRKHWIWSWILFLQWILRFLNASTELLGLKNQWFVWWNLTLHFRLIVVWFLICVILKRYAFESRIENLNSKPLKILDSITVHLRFIFVDIFQFKIKFPFLSSLTLFPLLQSYLN